MVEQGICNAQVVGSIPTDGSIFVLFTFYLEAAAWKDTQPFESMTTRDPAKLRLIGVVSWYQFQPVLYFWPYSLSVRTFGFHPEGRDSISRRATNLGTLIRVSTLSHLRHLKWFKSTEESFCFSQVALLKL